VPYKPYFSQSYLASYKYQFIERVALGARWRRLKQGVNSAHVAYWLSGLSGLPADRLSGLSGLSGLPADRLSGLSGLSGLPADRLSGLPIACPACRPARRRALCNAT